MKNILSIELGKAVKNRWFAISISFGALCVVMSLFAVLKNYYSDIGVMGIMQALERDQLASLEDFTQITTLYNSWIGSAGMTLGHSLFYTLLPLLAVLPCGWCFSEELNSGYLHTAIPLCGRKRYFTAKMAAYFLSGGLIALMPQLLSLLLTALFIPAVVPNILYHIYYPIEHGAMLSGLFYSHPMLYIAIVLGMDFVFGGLYAWLSMTVAILTRNRMSAIIIPFLLLLAGDMARTLILYISFLEISPLMILHPLSPSNIVKGWIVFAWMGILLVASVPILLYKGGRYEIS